MRWYACRRMKAIGVVCNEVRECTLLSEDLAEMIQRLTKATDTKVGLSGLLL